MAISYPYLFSPKEGIMAYDVTKAVSVPEVSATKFSIYLKLLLPNSLHTRSLCYQILYIPAACATKFSIYLQPVLPNSLYICSLCYQILYIIAACATKFSI